MMKKTHNAKPWIIGLSVFLLAFTVSLPLFFGLSQPVTIPYTGGETGTGRETAAGGETVAVTETATQTHASTVAPETAAPVYDENGVMLQSKQVVASRNKETENVHVNQVGYYARGTKRAIVTGGGTAFELIRLNDDGTGRAVYRGTVESTGTGKDALSGDRCYIADFTEYSEAGTYYISVNPGTDGEVTSYPFAISDHVLDGVSDALLKMFYYQRCGTALEGDSAGSYPHDACHTAAQTYQTRESFGGTPVYLDVTGGWHEAGDFSKTVSSGTSAAGCLLMAFENYPTAFDDANGIPESANGIPDVLDEVRYETDWLLKMQAESGGLYVTAFPWDHPGMIMPDKDTDTAYLVYPESLASTAQGVAVFEKMARLITPYDPAYANVCHEAALRGWEYINAHLDEEEDLYADFPLQKAGTNPSIKNSGASRLWAAVESFLYTGDKAYESIAYELRTEAGEEYLKWNFGGFGTAAYALSQTADKDETLQKLFSDKLLSAGRAVYDAYLKTGYEIPLAEVTMNTDFYICQNAFNMIAAQILNPALDYQAAIEGCMNYLLGSNPLDVSYITGFGTNSVNNVHHRQCYADGRRYAIPGYMVFGCARYEWISDRSDGLDAFMDEGTSGLYGFVDNFDYFRMTEVEIDSNALAVLVASFLEAN